MGAWSADVFGNDAASDWIYDFLERPGLQTIRATLTEILESEDYIESDLGSCGLAACEAIARLQGNWGKRDAYSEELDAWIEANPTSIDNSLKMEAGRTIEKVLGPNSELRELWGESGGESEWLRVVADLRERVQG